MTKEQVKDLSDFASVSEACEYIKSLYPEYPKKPAKPAYSSLKTSAHARQYADELDAWEESRKKYEADHGAYMDKVNHLNELLETHIKDVAGVSMVPKQYRDKLWSLAWDRGHSSGYSEVYNELSLLVDIFL
jgi:hypothetical protein